jgi:hypothetical protein
LIAVEWFRMIAVKCSEIRYFQEPSYLQMSDLTHLTFCPFSLFEWSRTIVAGRIETTHSQEISYLQITC